MVSAFTIFFSNKHLTPKGVYLHETMMALAEILKIKRNEKGEVTAEALKAGAKIVLPNNPLSEDIKKIIDGNRDKEYAHYIAHYYYEECHELYQVSADNYDFVSTTMPLWGLIGTVLGLIAMFDTLGADVTVEALSPQLALSLKTTLYGAVYATLYRIPGVRFEQRMKSLESDYDLLLKSLDVIMISKPVIEVAE
jgi:flagellar motor component MotA